jgi:hypothetical protein
MKNQLRSRGRIARFLIAALLSFVALAGLTVCSSVSATIVPVAVNDDYATPHNDTLSVDAAAGVGANDVVPPGFAMSLVYGPSFGDLVFNGDGSFVYTPDGGLIGVDQFAYQIAPIQPTVTPTLDTSSAGVGPAGAGAIATVDITLTNRVPTPQPDNYTTAQDTPLNVPTPGVLANDSDPDGDPIAITGVFDEVDHGTLDFDTDSGAFVYTPDPGFVGVDSFVYGIFDILAFPTKSLAAGDVTAQGSSADTTVTITVTGVETPTVEPTAEPSVVPTEPGPTEVPVDPTATSAGTGGVTDLPDTGASPDSSGSSNVFAAILVALALTGTGFLLRRRSRSTQTN